MALPCRAAPGVAVSSDFPGGNGLVGEIEQQRIHLAPDLRDIQPGHWWFYWNVRVEGQPDSLFQIVFRDKNPIGPRGPACSTDGGISWQWLGSGSVMQARKGEHSEWTFTGRIPPNGTQIKYAFCPEYVESHFRSWMSKHENHAGLKFGTLTTSRHGRPVELVRAGNIEDGQVRLLFITARHHSCEAMASYVMEGLLDAVLANDEIGKEWRRRWTIVAVPFMDKDGVEEGDQGKSRAPHDHNRDYNANPLYPEVRALMDLVTQSKARAVAFIDLHCPGLRGPGHERIYQVGEAPKKVAQEQQAFAAVLEKTQSGALRYHQEDDLEFGASWNNAARLENGRSSVTWAGENLPQAQLTTCFEIPYANARGQEVNAESARAFGYDLAYALLRFLK